MFMSGSLLKKTDIDKPASINKLKVIDIGF
jgi:hypothetical protein